MKDKMHLKGMQMLDDCYRSTASDTEELSWLDDKQLAWLCKTLNERAQMLDRAIEALARYASLTQRASSA